MKKTGSFALAALLAVSLSACNSSAEKMTSEPTAAQSATASAPESASPTPTPAPETSSEPAKSEREQLCEEAVSSLEVGKQIRTDKLRECLRASAAQLNTVYIEYTDINDDTLNCTGIVERAGDHFNYEYDFGDHKLRHVDGRFWIDAGDGWLEYPADDSYVRVVDEIGLYHKDYFYVEDRDLLFWEMEVADISDEGWKLELPPDESESDIPSWYIVNRDYHLTEWFYKNKDSTKGFIKRFSKFDEPVTIEPPH